MSRRRRKQLNADMTLPLNQRLADMPRQYGEPFLPLVPHIHPPQVSRETIAARIEGLPVLYARGVCAEQLWAYCHTGNIVNEQNYDTLRNHTPLGTGITGLILCEWLEAVACFRNRVPIDVQNARDRTMGLCLELLREWLKGVS